MAFSGSNSKFRGFVYPAATLQGVGSVRYNADRIVIDEGGSALAPLYFSTNTDAWPESPVPAAIGIKATVDSASTATSAIRAIATYTGTSTPSLGLSGLNVRLAASISDATPNQQMGQKTGGGMAVTLGGTYQLSSVITGVGGTVTIDSNGSLTTANSSAEFRGVYGEGFIAASAPNAISGATVPQITGVTGRAYNSLGSASTGTVSITAALLAQSPGAGSSVSSGLTVTHNAGLYIRSQTVNTRTTNNCGIAIERPTGGTNNYGIWVGRDSTSASVSCGIMFSASADTSFWRGAANQLLTQGDWSTRHYLSSSTPTVAAGAGAGTSPTIAITGTDHGFTVTLTQGNPSATGTVFTVTWGATWTSSAPAVSVSPGNAATAALTGTGVPYISAVSTTTMTFTSGATQLVAGTAYIFRFTAMR